MKKASIFLTCLFFCHSIYADNCPPVENLNPKTPPGGWVLFEATDLFGKGYYFVSATHSVNPSYYYQQTFCRYEACSAPGCPTFTLLSNQPYQQPATSAPPWGHLAQIINTVVCKPTNHDPYQCLFTNQHT